MGLVLFHCQGTGDHYATIAQEAFVPAVVSGPAWSPLSASVDNRLASTSTVEYNFSTQALLRTVLLLFKLIAALLVVGTLLPVSRARHWWVRVLDFPRLQISSALAIWILLYAVLWATGFALSPGWLFAMTGSLLYQLYWIWPSTSLHNKEVLDHEEEEYPNAARLKVLTSNVLMENRQADKLIALVNKHTPDVLAALETDAWWQEQLDTLNDYPYRIACPLDNLYGMHIYSRLPLLDTQTDYLVDPEIPSMSARIELTNGSRVRLHVIHPTPPVPGENDRSTERDVELLVLAKSLQGREEPIVVTGDLNDVAWSSTTRLFRRVSGLLDPRTGRGMYNTFHTDYWMARWPLDHVFTSNHFRVVSMQRLDAIGSDHFPMLVELALADRLELDTHPSEEDADANWVNDTLSTEVGEQASPPTLS